LKENRLDTESFFLIIPFPNLGMPDLEQFYIYEENFFHFQINKIDKYIPDDNVQSVSVALNDSLKLIG
jgi:hypothetical protein